MAQWLYHAQPLSLCIQDKAAEHPTVSLAKQQSALFKDDGEKGDDEEPVVPNLVHIASRFEEGGVGVGKTEAFRLVLALRKLAAKQPVQKLRFWGACLISCCVMITMLSSCCYYQISTKLHSQARFLAWSATTWWRRPSTRMARRPNPMRHAHCRCVNVMSFLRQETQDEVAADEEPADENADVLPQSQYKALPPLPVEEYGTGVNKKVYFVANDGALIVLCE